jgi:hypothetical protein
MLKIVIVVVIVVMIAVVAGADAVLHAIRGGRQGASVFFPGAG